MCTCECAELRIHGWMHTCLSCFLFLFLKVSHQFPVFLLKNNNNSKPPFYPDINPYFKESTKYDRLLIFRASSLFLLWNIKSDICKHVHAVFFLYKKSIAWPVAVQLICACPFQTSSPLTRQMKISPLFSKFEYAPF